MATERAPKTLREAILFFADYENCHKAVTAIRWPDGIVRCPTCGSDHVTYLASQRRWKCYAKHAKPQFSLKVGTIFEDSAIGLEKWLPALWLVTSCWNGTINRPVKSVCMFCIPCVSAKCRASSATT